MNWGGLSSTHSFGDPGELGSRVLVAGTGQFFLVQLSRLAVLGPPEDYQNRLIGVKLRLFSMRELLDPKTDLGLLVKERLGTRFRAQVHFACLLKI